MVLLEIPLTTRSAATPYRCMLLVAAPGTWLLCAMLRKPEVTVIGLLPILTRIASSRYISRRTFSFTVAAPTLPPSKSPLTWSTNSLQSKCRVEPSLDSSAVSLVCVPASTTPVAGSPYAVWNRLTAAVVIGPKSPSTATYVLDAESAAQPPTLICSSITSGPVEPCCSVPVHGYARAVPVSSGTAARPATTAVPLATAARRNARRSRPPRFRMSGCSRDMWSSSGSSGDEVLPGGGIRDTGRPQPHAGLV